MKLKNSQKTWNLQVSKSLSRQNLILCGSDLSSTSVTKSLSKLKLKLTNKLIESKSWKNSLITFNNHQKLLFVINVSKTSPLAIPTVSNLAFLIQLCLNNSKFVCHRSAGKGSFRPYKSKSITDSGRRNFSGPEFSIISRGDSKKSFFIVWPELLFTEH